MKANATLPESVLQPKVISAQRTAELAGVEYGGPQPTDRGTLHYFREPVTGTSICVWDAVLSLVTLEAAAKSARIRFGVEVLS